MHYCWSPYAFEIGIIDLRVDIVSVNIDINVRVHVESSLVVHLITFLPSKLSRVVPMKTEVAPQLGQFTRRVHSSTLSAPSATFT